MRPCLLLLFLRCLTGSLVADPLDFWTLAHSRTNHIPTWGAFGNGRFVVVAGGVDGGRSGIWVSDDGKEWRLTFEDAVPRLVFGNGLFVAAASGGRIVSSPDGETWVTRRLPVAGGGTAVVAAFGKFWTVANGGGAYSLLSSTDALAWEVTKTNVTADSVLYGDERTLVLSGNPQLVSFDGVELFNSSSLPLFSSVARLGETWVGVEAANPQRNVLVSTNGTDWSRFIPHAYFQDGGRVSVAGDRFVLISSGRQPFFLESKDGFTWTDHEVGLRLQIRDVVFGRDSILALSLQQLDTSKPGVYTSVGRFHASRPFTPTAPRPLALSLLPAVIIPDGVVGAGYSIESSDQVGGPWIPAATVFPTRFPYHFLAPQEADPKRFYRAMPYDR